MEFPGWHLIGAFPDGDPDDVGSWLLYHNGQAMLLEVPPGLKVEQVQGALAEKQASLKYVTASHSHEDHFNGRVWGTLWRAFPVEFMYPCGRDSCLKIGGEPLWLICAPKHSLTDVITVFRGVAHTGDIELGMLESVNDEVPQLVKAQTMDRLQGWCDKTGYHVHTVVSAHLNDVRININWRELFTYQR